MCHMSLVDVTFCARKSQIVPGVPDMSASKHGSGYGKFGPAFSGFSLREGFGGIPQGSALVLPPGAPESLTGWCRENSYTFIVWSGHLV